MVSLPTLSDDAEPVIDLANFRSTQLPVTASHAKSARQISSQRYKGEFVAAIPLRWLQPACAASGKVLAVALAIWFQLKRCKGRSFKLTTSLLKRFSVGRKASYAALTKLETLGLITVLRQTGKTPVITVKLAGE